MSTERNEMKVILIGCGGIGTWLASGVAKALQFHRPNSVLMLVDGDTFEHKNLERQQFSTMGNKAYVLNKDIASSNKNIFCVPKAAWIVPADMVGEEQDEDPSSEDGLVTVAKITAESIMDEGDVVLVCVDNYKARKLIFDAAQNYENIDVLTGGNDDALFGSVYHYCRRDGKDVTLHPAVMHDEFNNPTDANPGELSCQERAALDGGTQLLAVNMAVASHILAKISHLFLGTDEQREAALQVAEIMFDMESGLSLPYDRRPETFYSNAEGQVISTTSS